MLIRLKKRVVGLCLVLLLLVLPILYGASTTVSKGFKVDLAISNANPTINVSNVSGFSVDPIEGGSSVVLISFNVTDANGAGDINASTAVVNFTLGGYPGQFYANNSFVASSEFGTCKNHSPSSTVVVINCTVVLPYYANQSSNWVVNISVKDRSGAVGINDTLRFTYNILSAFSLGTSFINFSNVNLGQQNVRAYPHLLVNNTGNDDFNMTNLSASALVGTTNPAENIPVTNFGVNSSNSSTNVRLSFPANGIVNIQDAITGGNISFHHGAPTAFPPNADKGNISLFFWVNVPSSGLSPQLYNATWNLTAINGP